MSLHVLHALHQLLGQHLQQAPPQQHLQGRPGAYEDGSGVNMGQGNPNLQQGATQLPVMSGNSPYNPQQGPISLDNLPQGGQYNPGHTPLQNQQPLRYNRSPQHPFNIF